MFTVAQKKVPMKAIVVTDQAAGPAGMTLVSGPSPGDLLHARRSTFRW
jgi:hypothetical protein